MGINSMRIFCDSPFTNMTIWPDGQVFVCCARWTNGYSLGNAFTQTFEEVWNSPEAQALRASIHDGSFRYCVADRCGRLADGELSTDEMFNKNAILIKNKAVVLKKGPSKMTLNYDPSCNLSCPSCRTGLIFAPADEVTKMIAFQESVLSSDYFKTVTRVEATGTGDVFASKVYEHFLNKVNIDNYPDLRLELRTNGILLTPKVWDNYSNAHYAIDLLIISIDAATEKTYEQVRGKGFKKLIKNLEHLGKIKDKSGFTLEIRFVMQAANFREIPDFVRLGKHIGADRVYFTKLANWGTYPDFTKENVFNKNHPQHQNYLKVMQDPILNDPIVKIRHKPPAYDD